MVLQLALRAGQLDGHLGAGPVDLELDRDRLLRCVFRPFTRQLERDQQLGPVAGLPPTDVGHPHRQVPRRGLGIGQEVETDALRELLERVAQRLPAAALGVPVVGPRVGADPDLGAAGLVGLDVVVGGLQHRRQVGRGARPGPCWAASASSAIESSSRGLLLALSISTHRAEPRVASVRDSWDRPVSSFDPPVPAPGLLHAGRAVEQDDRRVGAAAAGQAQPAAGQRPADREDQPGDRQHPHRHDQPLADPGIAPRHPVGRQQEHHRRPADRLVSPLIDQVDDDRQRHQRQGASKHRLEEAHRTPFGRVRPTRNRIRSCS